jgi:hypothetical protein
MLELDNTAAVISTNDIITPSAYLPRECPLAIKQSSNPVHQIVDHAVQKFNITIRDWAYYEQVQDGTTSGFISIFTKDRFCNFLNREHSSNHTYWIIHLPSNMAYQKCTDPDCKSQIAKGQPLFSLNDQ